MKIHYFFCIAFMLISQSVTSQTDTIIGVLFDAKDKVIKRHIVMLGKEKSVSVKTNNQGVFTFTNANLQDTLFVGDKKGKNAKAIPVNGHKFLSIKSLSGNFDTEYISESNEEAYLFLQQQVAKTKISSSNKLTKEDIEKSGCFEVSCLLMRLTGVVVAGNTITLRGGSSMSLTLSSGALIVLDGIPMEDASSLLNLPVTDIDELSVLTDASIYGVRGANGAIVVRTRR